MSKRFFCGDCEHGWVRKIDYESHFTKKKINIDGSLVSNPCLNRKRKIFGQTLQEAKKIKKQKTISFTKEKSSFAANIITEEPSTSYASSSTEEGGYSNINVDLINSTKVSLDSNSIDDIVKSITQTVTVLVQSNSLTILKSLEAIQKTVKDISNYNHTKEYAHDGFQEFQGIYIPPKQEYEKLVQDIRACTGVEQILRNPLIKDIWKIESRTENENEVEKLVCQVCKKWFKYGNKINLGITLVDGATYSIYYSGVKKPMQSWFRNAKFTLAQHLESDTHYSALTKEMEDAVEKKRSQKRNTSEHEKFGLFRYKIQPVF